MYFGGGTVGRVVARNFPILQIHPQFGYSTSWVFFLSLASGGDLDSIHGINDSTCSKDATDVKGFTRSNGHVETCSPMKPCPQFARVASIDFHTLQPSEWMGATGGTVRMEVEVSTMLFMLFACPRTVGTCTLNFENLKFVHSCEQKSSLTLVDPFRWHFLCTGQVIIRDRKSYKGGIQLWISQWFFFMEILRLYSGYVSWHWEKPWGNMWNLWQ